MSKKLGARSWRTRAGDPRPPQSATSWSTESANHRAGSDLSLACLFQAHRNPLPEVLVHDGNSVAERPDCDICIAEQARSLNGKDSHQRNALCTPCAAQPPTITNSVKRKTSVGKPGDRPSWHGASAACTCRQMRSKADSANRSNLYDSTAHPALPNCRPVFQPLLRTSRRQHAFPRAHLATCTEQIDSARESPPSVSALRWTTLPDGNRDERCLKTTVGVPSAVISNSMGDTAASATSFAIPSSHDNIRRFPQGYVSERLQSATKHGSLPTISARL